MAFEIQITNTKSHIHYMDIYWCITYIEINRNTFHLHFFLEKHVKKQITTKFFEILKEYGKRY